MKSCISWTGSRSSGLIHKGAMVIAGKPPPDTTSGDLGAPSKCSGSPNFKQINPPTAAARLGLPPAVQAVVLSSSDERRVPATSAAPR